MPLCEGPCSFLRNVLWNIILTQMACLADLLIRLKLVVVQKNLEGDHAEP